MQASLVLLCNGGTEWMAGFLLPWDLHQPHQQQQQLVMTAGLYCPAPPIPVDPLSYSLANPPLSMEQSLTNLGFQSNRPGAALPQQHMASVLQELMTSFLLSKLAKAQERMMELEARLRRAEQKRETWQRIARDPLTVGVCCGALLVLHWVRDVSSAPLNRVDCLIS